MHDGENKVVQWDNKVGPATVGLLLQTVVLIGGGFAAYQSMRDSVDNSKQTVTELRNIVETMRTASTTSNERVTRVEERTEFVVKQLDRIEKKVNTIAR